MKTSIPLLILTLLIASCSSKALDEYVVFDGCRLLASDLFIIWNPGIGDMDKTEFYAKEYEYNAKNQLSKRLNYEPPTGNHFYGKRLISTDSLVYDSRNRVVEIHSLKANNYQPYEIDIFLYNRADLLPYKRIREGYWSQEVAFVYHEDIYYNHKDQIIKTILRNVTSQNAVHHQNHPSEANHLTPTISDVSSNNFLLSTTNYTYHATNNIAKIETVMSQENASASYICTIEQYDDYDAEKNPFKAFPFVDLRGIAYSPNNPLSYSKERYFIKESKPDLEINNLIYGASPNLSNQSSWTFSYNHFGYPENGIYECSQNRAPF